jgi:hypothetical protein
MKKIAMTIKHHHTIIAGAVIISIILPLLLLNHQEKGIRYTIFPTDGGWGYDIVIDKRLFIHQEFIPCLPGKRAFLEKKRARRAAEIIINKMKRKQLPTITKFEIDQVLNKPGG